MYRVKANLYLFYFNGRSLPFSSGYRPAFKFENTNSYFTGKIDLIDDTEFKRGTQSEVVIYFLRHEGLEEFLNTGAMFTINEPPHVVGEGKIIEVSIID